MSRPLVLAVVLGTLAGCAGNPKYACGVPEGVGCKPLGEVYKDSVTGRSTRPPADGKTDSDHGSLPPSSTPEVKTPRVTTVQPGDPLLTRPHHLRVWVNRWEDDAGDLHDETYLYLRLDNGDWRLAP